MIKCLNILATNIIECQINFIFNYFPSCQYLTKKDPGCDASQQVSSVEKTIAFEEKVIKKKQKHFHKLTLAFVFSAAGR